MDILNPLYVYGCKWFMGFPNNSGTLLRLKNLIKLSVSSMFGSTDVKNSTLVDVLADSLAIVARSSNPGNDSISPDKHPDASNSINIDGISWLHFHFLTANQTA